MYEIRMDSTVEVVIDQSSPGATCVMRCLGVIVICFVVCFQRQLESFVGFCFCGKYIGFPDLPVLAFGT